MHVRPLLLQAKTTGEIVNLMAVDAQRLQDLMSYFSTLWSAPYQVSARVCMYVCLCVRVCMYLCTYRPLARRVNGWVHLLVEWGGGRCMHVFVCPGGIEKVEGPCLAIYTTTTHPPTHPINPYDTHKVALALFFLWRQLGIAILGGLGIMLISIPISAFVAKRTR